MILSFKFVVVILAELVLKIPTFHNSIWTYQVGRVQTKFSSGRDVAAC